MIQGKRPILWEVIVSVIVGKKEAMNMCLVVEQVLRRLFLSLDPTPLDFLFVGLDEERSLQQKGGYTRRIARSHFGCCCLHKDEQHAIFANESRGVLRLTVGFCNICCEL